MLGEFLLYYHFFDRYAVPIAASPRSGASPIPTVLTVLFPINQPSGQRSGSAGSENRPTKRKTTICRVTEKQPICALCSENQEKSVKKARINGGKPASPGFMLCAYRFNSANWYLWGCHCREGALLLTSASAEAVKGSFHKNVGRIPSILAFIL